LIRTDYTVQTAGGQLSCVRRQTPDDFGVIEEPFIKEERDIELLRYRPHPRYVGSPDLIRSDFEAMGALLAEDLNGGGVDAGLLSQGT
jgi:hypothetical protein